MIAPRHAAVVPAQRRARLGEAVQGAFPLMFVLFFLSSINLPRELIEVGIVDEVPNPLGYG